MITAVLVSIASHGIQEMGNDDVTAYYGIHCPFCSEKGDTWGSAAEDVFSFYEDSAAMRGETFPCEDL